MLDNKWIKKRRHIQIKIKSNIGKKKKVEEKEIKVMIFVEDFNFQKAKIGRPLGPKTSVDRKIRK